MDNNSFGWSLNGAVLDGFNCYLWAWLILSSILCAIINTVVIIAITTTPVTSIGVIVLYLLLSQLEILIDLISLISLIDDAISQGNQIGSYWCDFAWHSFLHLLFTSHPPIILVGTIIYHCKQRCFWLLFLLGCLFIVILLQIFALLVEVLADRFYWLVVLYGLFALLLKHWVQTFHIVPFLLLLSFFFLLDFQIDTDFA